MSLVFLPGDLRAASPKTLGLWLDLSTFSGKNNNKKSSLDSQVGTSDASAGIKVMPSKVPGPPLTMQVATQRRSKRASLTTGKLGVNSYPAGNARAFSVPLVSSSPWAVERTMHRSHVQTGYPCRYIHWGEHDASWAQIGPKLGLFGGKAQPGLKTARWKPACLPLFLFFLLRCWAMFPALGRWLLHGLKLRHVRPTCAQARPSCAMLLSPSWTQAVQVGLKFRPVGPKSACVRPNLRPRTAEFAPSRLRLGHLGPCSSPCVPAPYSWPAQFPFPPFQAPVIPRANYIS